MNQGQYTVQSNEQIADKTWRLRLCGSAHGFTTGGQFADIAIDGYFLRRPIAVREWNEHGFELIYKVVGHGTEKLTGSKPGTSLDILTALGNGFNADRCAGSALLISGGIGASPLFSLAKQLKAQGKRVCVIMGYNKASEIILSEEYRSLGVDLRLVTLDGSAGLKGLVTDALSIVNPEYDYFYTCGPKIMMEAVCKACVTSGEASLEERMGCGCGICYGCTCHTAKGPARICADGPVFNKEDIIW